MTVRLLIDSCVTTSRLYSISLICWRNSSILIPISERGNCVKPPVLITLIESLSQVILCWSNVCVQLICNRSKAFKPFVNMIEYCSRKSNYINAPIFYSHHSMRGITKPRYSLSEIYGIFLISESVTHQSVSNISEIV